MQNNLHIFKFTKWETSFSVHDDLYPGWGGVGTGEII